MEEENGKDVYSAGHESGETIKLLSFNQLNSSLEKLLLDAAFDYSDAEIVVEGISVGVNRCILASRSPFFHELFNKRNVASANESKPKYVMTELVPRGKIGYEAFMVFLNYVYSGKLNPSPREVSTCVDESCAHDACAPAINFAVELMYASANFQIKELVSLFQRQLLNFVDKASVEDVIPIVVVAFHFQLNQLLSHSVQRVASSDLDDLTLDKELPYEVLPDIKSFREQFNQDMELDADQFDFMYRRKSIRRIHKALDYDDIELMKLLLQESNITLDDAFALHYAAAYCNPKVFNEVLSLGIADLNLRNSRGYTVLHVASRCKDPSVIVGLLCKGASVLDSTMDGQTSVTICRRLTRPKDYNESIEQGQPSNKERLCIDILERERRRHPVAGTMSVLSMISADDLVRRLLVLEHKVSVARALLPTEVKLAMGMADADSYSEFHAFPASNSLRGSLKMIDLNENPSEQEKQLQARLQALRKAVEKGRRFYPSCCEVLGRFLDDDLDDIRIKVIEAFETDKARIHPTDLSLSSPSETDTILLERARKLLRGNNVFTMGLEEAMMVFNNVDKDGNSGTCSSPSSSSSMSSVNQVVVRKRKLC